MAVRLYLDWSGGEVPPRLSCTVLSRVYEHFGILPSQMLSPWEGEGPPEE